MRTSRNLRAQGTYYEEQAVSFLEERGYRILARNFRCPKGEIDIISRDGEYLVFTEVKYRSTPGSGEGLEAVDYRKQRRISQSAIWYLTRYYPDQTPPCRFDVVSFLGNEITLIQDAFWMN